MADVIEGIVTRAVDERTIEVEVRFKHPANRWSYYYLEDVVIEETADPEIARLLGDRRALHAGLIGRRIRAEVGERDFKSRLHSKVALTSIDYPEVARG